MAIGVVTPTTELPVYLPPPMPPALSVDMNTWHWAPLRGSQPQAAATGARCSVHGCGIDLAKWAPPQAWRELFNIGARL